MTLEEFFIKSKSGKFNHKWIAINSGYHNYICNKCNLKSILAYSGSSCISNEEAIIKKLLE
jgi:hypothetical protein